MRQRDRSVSLQPEEISGNELTVLSSSASSRCTWTRRGSLWTAWRSLQRPTYDRGTWTQRVVESQLLCPRTTRGTAWQPWRLKYDLVLHLLILDSCCEKMLPCSRTRSRRPCSLTLFSVSSSLVSYCEMILLYLRMLLSCSEDCSLILFSVSSSWTPAVKRCHHIHGHVRADPAVWPSSLSSSLDSYSEMMLPYLRMSLGCNEVSSLTLSSVSLSWIPTVKRCHRIHWRCVAAVKTAVWPYSLPLHLGLLLWKDATVFTDAALLPWRLKSDGGRLWVSASLTPTLTGDRGVVFTDIVLLQRYVAGGIHAVDCRWEQRQTLLWTTMAPRCWRWLSVSTPWTSIWGEKRSEQAHAAGGLNSSVDPKEHNVADHGALCLHVVGARRQGIGTRPCFCTQLEHTSVDILGQFVASLPWRLQSDSRLLVPRACSPVWRRGDCFPASTRTAVWICLPVKLLCAYIRRRWKNL